MLPSAVLDQFEAPLRLRQLDGAYLCSNSMGIIPSSAVDAEVACLRLEQRSGIEVWDNGAWMEVLNRYARVIARYMAVEPDQVCPVTNITDGIWRILSALKFRGKRTILLQTAMEFTTQLYANFGFEGFGAEVVTVPSDDEHHFVPTDRMVNAILRLEPAVVNLSHAAFESGYLHDVRAIADACHKVGAVFLLDSAQTGFVLPFTLESTGADVILLQQHKWGCAGTGAACIVASRRFITQHAPKLVGWMSHENTWAFDKGPATFGPSAWRYMGGTPDVPSKARGAVAAEIIIDQLGIDAVFAHNQALVAQLLQGLTELADRYPLGLKPIHLSNRAGFVVMECQTMERAKAVEAALRSRHIVIDGRGTRLRVGAHFYNTSSDIQCLIDALEDLHRTQKI